MQIPIVVELNVFHYTSTVGWLVVLRIYVALAVFQPYRDLEAEDNQSLKFKLRGGESNPGPLALQAELNHSVTTAPYILQMRNI